MNFRKASLIALLITFIAGTVSFVLSFQLPMSSVGLVIGSGYYPRLLSAILMISSAVGFFFNYRKKENDQVEFSIPHVGKFLLVLGLAILLAAVWQATHEFYPICIAVVLVLLWLLNPEPPSPRKALKSVGITAIIMAAIFAIFTVVLQLNL